MRSNPSPDRLDILRDLTAPWEVWLMDQGFEASVPPGYQLGLCLFQPAEFSVITGVTMLMCDATWSAVRQRHPLERLRSRPPCWPESLSGQLPLPAPPGHWSGPTRSKDRKRS